MLVSVIIADLFERHLPETVENLRATADGPIEIIIKPDHESKGMRYCLNRAAEEARGEFLFKLDGHCIMTPHWDTILKAACADPADMAVCRIKSIDEKNWVMKDKGFSFVTIRPDLSIVSCGEFVADDPDTAETMASIGCGWMIHRQRFMDLGMNMESLGRYGNLGVEWALKVWLSGGKVLVNRFVTCGHLFRQQLVTGCGIDEQRVSARQLGLMFQHKQGPLQKYSLEWLANRFLKTEINTEVVRQ
jgi:hypothetical protein